MIVSGESMKKIYEAVVMHVGWEMDNAAWIIENEDGTREIRTTSYGGEYSMKMSELEEKIKETAASLDGLMRLKELSH
jgi:hypothetical protein